MGHQRVPYAILTATINGVSAACIALACGLATFAATPPSGAPPTKGTAKAEAEQGMHPESVLEEHVRVTASRLQDQGEEIAKVSAHVTVIDAEEIARSGARTLQELLGLVSGVLVYDQVGNETSSTLDLRGFKDGTGVAVLLDGAPLNDPRNDGLALELVPLAALDRVEISRGPAAALTGGGGEAGTIRLVTRAAADWTGSLSVARGSDDAGRYTGALGGKTGNVDFFLSGDIGRSDGFRQNAGGDLDRFAATAGVDLGSGRRLELSLFDGTSDLGNPGALNEAEIENDPRSAPYNTLDFTEQRSRQAVLGFRGSVGAGLSLAANLFVQDRSSDSLTTGRSAATFGGFYLESDAAIVGSTVQLSATRRAGRAENLVVVGVEALRGETDAEAFFTPPDDLALVDPANRASDNTTERRTLALFVQDRWSPVPHWHLSAGLRVDSDRIGFDERFPGSSDGENRYSELSLRLGATRNFGARWDAYASYAEGFRAPTAEQLFAFPGFGSNPDLDAEDSRSYEIGARLRAGERLDASAALFRIDTRDEIIFDPGSPLGAFGANDNAGKTRRTGIELELRGRLAARVRGFASVTLLDAEFAAGPTSGSDLPLVPRERVAAGVDLDLPARLRLRADALYVGEQVVDNDDPNAEPPLDAYTLANARLSWRILSERPAAGARRSPGAWLLFAEVRNVFDREYVTRGIFSATLGQVFLTPAPGRRYLAGIEWIF